MNTWTPLWSSTVDSTLWEEPPHVRLMFLTMLMLRDPDHVVRLPLRVLSKKANLDSDRDKAYKLAEEALIVLKSPDKRSPEKQGFEGRRIEAVEDGWLILNGAKYLQQMRGLSARLRKTQLQRERRALAKRNGDKPPLPRPVTGGPASRAERLADNLERRGEPEQAERIAGMGTPRADAWATGEANPPSLSRPSDSPGPNGGTADAQPNCQTGLEPGPEFLT